MPATLSGDLNLYHIPQGTAKSSSSSDGRPRLANASGDESMDCEQAEAESVEKSDIELPNNSPNGTTTTSTVEKLRKRFLDKIDTVKNITYMVDDEITMSTALKQLENIQLMLKKSCSSTHGIPLRISPVKKKLKITSTEYHQVFHKKLPPRRRWKKKTPKADVIFIEEDSNDDVDDDDAKRKVSFMFNDKVSRERKIRLRLFDFDVCEISNIFLVSTGKLQTTVSTAYRKHN